MRIAYIVHSLTIAGGLERVLTDRLNALAADGRHSFFIVCVAQRSDESNYYKLSDEIKQYNLNCPFLPSTTFKKNPVRFFLARVAWEIKYNRLCRKTLDEIKPDVLVSTVFFVPGCFYFFKGKRVLESHGDRASTMQAKMLPFLARLSEKRADAVVTLTDEDKRAFNAAARVEVIPNFTNIEPVTGGRYDEKSMLAVGRLCHQKGMDILIDAWAKVSASNPEWTLHIYGDGPDRKALEEQIMKNNLSSKIVLHGAVKNIAEAYARHDALLLTSRYEGFGMVLVEAMTCGLPSVSFDCPCGPADIIDHGKNGLLVQQRGLSHSRLAENMAEAIEWMINNPKERRKMAEAAKEKAKIYNKKTIIDRWLQLFDTL